MNEETRPAAYTSDEPVAPTAVSAAAVPTGRAALLATSGLLLGAAAAWGGIVPYIGAWIHFALNGEPAWRWNEANTVLHLIPGAVGVLCGLILIGSGPAFFGARPFAALAALLGMAAGAWFVIGQVAWRLIQPTASGGGVYIPGSLGVDGTALHRFVYEVGYFWGPGLLMVAFASIALGLLYHPVPRLVGREVADPAGREPHRRHVIT